MGHYLGWLGLGFIVLCASAPAATCKDEVAIELFPPEVTPLEFQMPGMQIASLVDPTRSTGATVFYFPKGATANFDSRGGAVASIETTLIEEGSYSNEIDAIVFTGGSTMGLASTDGVRKIIFDHRKNSNEFDFIPSVPGAVVYDYGGRIHPSCDPFVFPSRELGEQLMCHLSKNTFPMGRAGAGVCTTVNKVGEPYWGGQGAAFKRFPWGRIFAAVVLNSVGQISKDGVPALDLRRPGKVPVPRAGQNTTLSLIVTDVKLDRSALKRLAIMVHTSMARNIHPFHGSTDGDIHFAVSLGTRRAPNEDVAWEIEMAASELMEAAIINSVQSANRIP